MPEKSKTSLHALTVTYLVALLGLAALAIASYLIPQREYRNQRISDEVLRVAGRQEALLERVAFLAYHLATAREPGEQKSCREKLSRAVNEMESAHRALLTDERESPWQGNPPPSVRAIYLESPFLLDRQMRQFVSDVRSLVRTPEAELSSSNSLVVAIRAAAEGRLMAGLEAVVREHQKLDETGVGFLQLRETETLWATLLVLLGTGLFIFRPMVRRISREQEALRESERRMATLLNNLPGAAYRLPRHDRQSPGYVSQVIGKLTEYEPECFVGPSATPFASLIVPEDRPAVKDAICRAVSRQEPYVIEYRIRTRTGKEKWLWEKGICVRDDQGRPVALEGFIEDITQWTRAEEARVQAERLAAVGSMAAKLAHEIRNPLGTIKLNLDLLGDEVEALGPGGSANTDEARTLLQAVTSEVRRIQRVTEDYLQFSRLPKLHRERVTLNEILIGKLGFLTPMFDTARVVVATEFDPALPAIEADPDQLWQAILNLIRNALEAMPDGGTLTLRTSSDADEVALRLADTGKGMSEEERSHIFRPFFTTKPVGTGLGLTLTQQIIIEHGGRIECASVAGRGTTFSLSFPLARRTFSAA